MTDSTGTNLLCVIFDGEKETLLVGRGPPYILKGEGFLLQWCSACSDVLQGMSNCTASLCGYWTAGANNEVIVQVFSPECSCSLLHDITGCYVTKPHSRIFHSAGDQLTILLFAICHPEFGGLASPPMSFLPPSIIIFPSAALWYTEKTYTYILQYLLVTYKRLIPDHPPFHSYSRHVLRSIPSWDKSSVPFPVETCSPIHTYSYLYLYNIHSSLYNECYMHQ